MAGRPAHLAIVGATGAAGRALLQALEESDLEVATLRLLATERSAGAELDFRGELRRVEAVDERAFDGLDLALLAVPPAASREWGARAWSRGCAVVDLSPAFRLDPEVPLVVPELNPDSVVQFRRRGVVATPGAGAVQLALVLAALEAAAGVERVVVSTCVAVSGAGQRAIEELEQQTRAMMAFQEPPEPVAVPQRVAFNLVPQVGAFEADGSTEEERRLVEETRRLLGAGAPRISATALHVPLFYGISQVVNVRTTRPLSAGAARDALRGARGVKVVDDPAQGVYPMPMLAVNDEAVLVGRIREDASQDRGLDLLVVADNLRRGAAATALGVAQLLLERHLASH